MGRSKFDLLKVGCLTKNEQNLRFWAGNFDPFPEKQTSLGHRKATLGGREARLRAIHLPILQGLNLRDHGHHHRQIRARVTITINNHDTDDDDYNYYWFVTITTIVVTTSTIIVVVIAIVVIMIMIIIIMTRTMDYGLYHWTKHGDKIIQLSSTFLHFSACPFKTSRKRVNSSSRRLSSQRCGATITIPSHLLAGILPSHFWENLWMVSGWFMDFIVWVLHGFTTSDLNSIWMFMHLAVPFSSCNVLQSRPQGSKSRLHWWSTPGAADFSQWLQRIPWRPPNRMWDQPRIWKNWDSDLDLPGSSKTIAHMCLHAAIFAIFAAWFFSVFAQLTIFAGQTCFTSEES